MKVHSEYRAKIKYLKCLKVNPLVKFLEFELKITKTDIRKMISIRPMIIILLLISSFFFSCEDFLEADTPETEIISASVYNSDDTATAALVGIYSRMMESSYGSGNILSFTLLGGLSADEFIHYSFDAEILEFYNNALLASNRNNLSLWNLTYRYIYQANAVIEGLHETQKVTDTVKRQLEGEAKFIRAFLYFYLTNYYGEVPLITGTDYRANTVAYRESVEQVYEQIINDLLDAKELLKNEYITTERVRPNKWAATALLSRVYLFTENWINAEKQATEIIENTGLYNLELDLNNVFLNSSREAIWQLMPVVSTPTLNTWEGYRFILLGAPTNNESLSNSIMDAFEDGDKRRNQWIGELKEGETIYYYPYKYKIKNGTTRTEYTMVFRLAEQYLIRAEALARQGNLTEAIANVDVIRERAGLPLFKDYDPGMDQAELLDTILQERRIEFFTEWGGYRWLDLKRTRRADAVLGLEKSGWQATDVLYPIPQSEIENNPNLTQNEGY